MMRSPSTPRRGAAFVACTVTLAACLPLASPAPVTRPTTTSSAPAPPAASEDTRHARAFDQQGVLAFEAGRYRDALLYFDAAFAHGGPASERWNAAKCYLHLDEPEKADSTLVAYLALPSLSADDRREANGMLEEIRRRASTLTVMSTPLGLPVSVDGRKVGVTPLSVPMPAGDHVVVVHRTAGSPDERVITAALGRAILIEARP